MDQCGGPQQVVDIVEASSNSKGKGDRVDSCYSKTATVLGILHILCGVITLFCGILIGLDNYGFFLVISGTLTSIFSFISGGLAIGGAQSGSKCLVVATMVMSIISAVIASFLLYVSSGTIDHYDDDDYTLDYGYYIVMFVLGAIMLFLPIISASITRRHISCNPATVLGILEIIGGVIILALGIFGGFFSTVFLVLGILTAIFLFVSGGLAIGGAQSGSRCLQVASMVMSIISAVIVSFPFLGFLSSVIRSECAPYGCDAFFLPLIILAVMLVLSITSASISSYHLKICCCSPLNCRSAKHGGSDSQPNPVNQVLKVPNEITQVQTCRMSNAPRHTTKWAQTTWSRPTLTR